MGKAELVVKRLGVLTTEIRISGGWKQAVVAVAFDQSEKHATCVPSVRALTAATHPAHRPTSAAAGPIHLLQNQCLANLTWMRSTGTPWGGGGGNGTER